MGDETLIIVRPPVRDRYGDIVPGTGEQIPVHGCVVAPRGSSGEDNKFASTVYVGLTAYMPAGIDVRPTDQILVQGVPYDVIGEPASHRHPLGWNPGISVTLNRREG